MKNKHVAAFLMAALLLFVSVTGCQDTPEPVDSVPPAPQESDAPSTPTADNTQTEETGEFRLPIVDEKVDLTIWTTYTPAATTRLKSEYDNLAVIEMEKRTNVHIVHLFPSSTDAQAQFNLSIASGDLPDSYITDPNFYIGGLDKYIEDGTILDLTELTDLFPNYQRIRTADDDTRRRTSTDNGKIPGIYEIVKRPQPSFIGLVARGDLLDSWGVEKPRTYQEYHDLLVRFRDAGMDTPLLLWGANGLDDGFMAGYDVAWSNYNGFFHVGNEVKFAPLEQGFKEYVTMMSQWYSEGLIDPNFTTPRSFGDHSAYANGEAGIWSTLYTLFTPIELSSNVEGFRITTVEPPIKNEGDHRKLSIYFQSNSLVVAAIQTVTTACENVDVMLKFYDYLFTEEGSLLANYGIEGLTYNMVDGKPVFTDLVLNDTEGYGSIYAIWGDYLWNITKRWYDWERELLPTMSDETLNAGPFWDQNFIDEYTLPFAALSISPEDGAKYSSIINDANTYINESVAKFITGATPLSEYDKFIATLKEMGVEEAIALLQDSYDRFINR